MRLHVWDNSPSPCETYHFRLQSTPVPPEVCDDGIDNDLDGIIDCSDYSCLDDATCTGVCPPEDTHEPNNTQAAALPGLTGLLSDLAVHQQNEDWFEISVGPEQIATLTVDLPSLDANIDLELYDAAGDVVDSSTGNVLQQQLTWINFSDQEEVLDARVFLRNGPADVCGAYDLTLDVQDIPAEICNDGDDNDLDGATDCDDYSCISDAACAGVCPDEDPFEDNDTPELAYGGLSGLIQDLMIHRQDPDWFALDVDNGDLVEVVAEFDNSLGNIDLRLVDADGAVLTTAATTNNLEAMSYVNTTGNDQTVFAHIALRPGAAVCSAYDLSLYSGPIPDESCDDTLDNDLDGFISCLDYDCIEDAACVGSCPTEDVLGIHDTLATALPGNTGFPNLTVHPQVPDVFAVELPPNTRTTLEAAFTNADGNIDFVVKNALGWVIYETTGTGDTETYEVVNDHGGPSTVYVEVKTDTCNAYDWSFSSTDLLDENCSDNLDNDNDGRSDCADADCWVQCSCPSDDALEPNDTAPTASELVFHESALVTNIDNQDFFTYTVEPGQTLESTITYDPALSGNTDLYLYDANGDLQTLSLTNNTTETLSWANTGSESVSVYLNVRVQSGSTNPCSTYSLDTTFTQ